MDLAASARCHVPYSNMRTGYAACLSSSLPLFFVAPLLECFDEATPLQAKLCSVKAAFLCCSLGSVGGPGLFFSGSVGLCVGLVFICVGSYMEGQLCTK